MRMQEIVDQWVRDTFGDDSSSDVEERVFRFVEEAVELAQTTSLTKEQLHVLVDYVYSRPVGEPGQEVGGIMVTLYAAACAMGLDVERETVKEVARVHRPEVVRRCRARQAEKREVLKPRDLQGETG